jgi:hypothetical protein
VAIRDLARRPHQQVSHEVDSGKMSPRDPASILAAASKSSEERKRRAISAKSHVFRRGKIEAAKEEADK